MCVRCERGRREGVFEGVLDEASVALRYVSYFERTGLILQLSACDLSGLDVTRMVLIEN